jgi:hypothetical protein
MISNILAQYILDSYLNSKQDKFIGRIKEKFLRFIRNRLIHRINPEVKYNFAGKNIIIPFSHELPLYRKFYGIYSDNIGRLAALIKKQVRRFNYDRHRSKYR